MAHLALQGDPLVVEHGRESLHTAGVWVQRLQQVGRAAPGQVVRFGLFHVGAGRVAKLGVADLLHGHVALAQDNDGIARFLFRGRLFLFRIVVVVAAASKRPSGHAILTVVNLLVLSLKAWGVHLRNTKWIRHIQ